MMSYTFFEEDAVEKVDWCKENLCPGGKNRRWYWGIDHGRPGGDGVYRPTKTCIIIKHEADAMAYKLRWV